MHISAFLRGAAPRRAPGFTIAELMVVLAIGAVLTAIAAPSFTSTVAKYRMGTESANLLDSLLMARDEARNSASPVTVCTSNNGTACTSSAWEAGHIVFRDTGSAGAVDGTDTVIRRVEAASRGITIKTTLQQGGAVFARGYLQFLADGKLDPRTAIVFTTCKATHIPLLTAVQYNGSTSSSKGAGACP